MRVTQLTLVALGADFALRCRWPVFAAAGARDHHARRPAATAAELRLPPPDQPACLANGAGVTLDLPGPARRLHRTPTAARKTDDRPGPAEKSWASHGHQGFRHRVGAAQDADPAARVRGK